MCSSQLYWTLSYFSFCQYWIISTSTFASLLDIPRGIASSVIGSKNFKIAAGIEKYKLTTKKKIKKHDKIILLGKTKLNSVQVLIFKALINSNNSHDEFDFNK